MTTYIKLNRLGLGSNKLLLISGAKNENNDKTKNPKKEINYEQVQYFFPILSRRS